MRRNVEGYYNIAFAYFCITVYRHIPEIRYTLLLDLCKRNALKHFIPCLYSILNTRVFCSIRIFSAKSIKRGNHRTSDCGQSREPINFPPASSTPQRNVDFEGNATIHENGRTLHIGSSVVKASTNFFTKILDILHPDFQACVYRCYTGYGLQIVGVKQYMYLMLRS